ncbi:MAG: D-alanyl-D-alanine carboxypeptidase, partial [Actinobacteria bacterium]|nr:D-alanyl-D-alanine carboxypeptidase [Actinomycetota bacterium]
SSPAAGQVLDSAGWIAGGPAVATRRPLWQRKIDRLVHGRNIGVMVSSRGKAVYRKEAGRRRVPASNQKLLLSMALLDRLGAGERIPTGVWARAPKRGAVRGNLWIVGRGDPSLAGGERYARSLPFRAARLGALARRIKNREIRRIKGRVVGATGYFKRDWFAPGWKKFFPWLEVALPTALTFNGNIARRKHTRRPEREAARSLTRKLERIGVSVRRSARMGPRPARRHKIASIRARPLGEIMRYMNRKSNNFFAEVLGKRLGVERSGPPGTIAKGARAIRSLAARRGVRIVSKDSSGLSYANRVSPRGITKMLEWARRQPWGRRLRKMLPTGGQGTLEDRLGGAPVRAKTGTLDGISALSGYVWLSREGATAEFSILSRGLPKYKAVTIENRIVKILVRNAR